MIHTNERKLECETSSCLSLNVLIKRFMNITVNRFGKLVYSKQLINWLKLEIYCKFL